MGYTYLCLAIKSLFVELLHLYKKGPPAVLAGGWPKIRYLYMWTTKI